MADEDQTHRGKVVVIKWNDAGDRYFGFVRPADSDGDKSRNIWFGDRAVQGMAPAWGDQVEYILHHRPNPNKTCASAYRLWRVEKAK